MGQCRYSWWRHTPNFPRRSSMSAPLPLYQTLLQRISAAVPATVRRSAVTRLTLLVTGILAAKSTVLAQLAAELDALELTAATPESIERRLRRTLNDPQ